MMLPLPMSIRWSWWGCPQFRTVLEHPQKHVSGPARFLSELSEGEAVRVEDIARQAVVAQVGETGRASATLRTIAAFSFSRRMGALRMLL